MIDDFHGDHYWLDNMWLVPIRWSDGLEFNSVEQGFVYFKASHAYDRKRILRIEDPYEAKAYGREMLMRSDWDDIKFGIMYELVKKKFEQNDDLRAELLDTGDILLVEGNNWDDNIWGDCYCPRCVDIPGQNWLGMILMSVRAQFRDSETDIRSR